ncbi:MAG TPA: hypothetical protein PKC49_06625 [Phycisphaerae bacterium]|nr:hypothetical protein [Phycisphaerae bacterium]
MTRFLVAAVSLCACAVGARAQLGIVDDIPGVFIDISNDPRATILVLGDDDEGSFVTSIGNAVIPAGTVWVGNNGGLGVAPINEELEPLNAPLPSDGAWGGARSLLPLWDDIGNDIGQVAVMQQDNRVIVQWTGKPLNDSLITFQVQIFDASEASNPIAQFLYLDIDNADAAASATIGFQAGHTLNDVQWSFNRPGAVTDGTVLTLIPEPGCLTGLVFLALLRRRR